MNIQDLGRSTIESCRSHGWAALETGISRPVPEVLGGVVRLWYLLYRSQVRPPYQVLYEPFARVAVDYATGKIVEHQELTTSTPPRALGRYPHAAAAKVPPAQWPSVWDELFDLYPHLIDAFVGMPIPGLRDKVLRWIDLFDLTTPPFMKTHYRSLNPAFFDWLARVQPGSQHQ